MSDFNSARSYAIIWFRPSIFIGIDDRSDVAPDMAKMGVAKYFKSDPEKDDPEGLIA
jgi:hypothetical protein